MPILLPYDDEKELQPIKLELEYTTLQTLQVKLHYQRYLEYDLFKSIIIFFTFISMNRNRRIG